ncbi:hypothetical protein TL16_g09715 [Triparma laevis f. inornata]|uniref:Uncharacterized protein n=1 Tax=Triparma laevis f. inornata TaxID=1714386 RepID=A0A9W7BC36_9STRA|nr:hypothetical protein TL16_g09715 [Triparma laevis f. inornata]
MPLTRTSTLLFLSLSFLIAFWSYRSTSFLSSTDSGIQLVGVKARKKDWGGLDWRTWLEKVDGNLEFAKARGVEGDADMKKWNQLDPPEGFDPMLYIKRGDFEYDGNNMDAGLHSHFTPPTSSSYTTILHNKNILLVSGLHSCWAHALLDTFVFMVQGIKNFKGEPFIIWFRGASLVKFPVENPIVPGDTGESHRYNDTRADLCDLLSAESIIFEHLFDSNERILIKDSTVVDIRETGGGTNGLLGANVDETVNTILAARTEAKRSSVGLNAQSSFFATQF